MKKQYAVFGLGSFGESVAIELQKLGCEVVAIDANMERVEAIANQVSYAMKADIEDADFIRSLGTRNLDGVVVAASDNMEASIMATLVCKEIGVPYVMAKAKNELHATVLEKIGADSVIFPEKEMGMRVARNLMSANFTDWIALSPHYSLVETEVPEKWVGRTLLELDVRKTYGCGNQDGRQSRSQSRSKRTTEGRECSDFDWSKSGIGSYTVEEWRKMNEFYFSGSGQQHPIWLEQVVI